MRAIASADYKKKNIPCDNYIFHVKTVHIDCIAQYAIAASNVATGGLTYQEMGVYKTEKRALEVLDDFNWACLMGAGAYRFPDI